MRCRWCWMCLRFVTLENKSIITYFFFCSVSLRKWATTDFIVGQNIFGDNMRTKFKNTTEFIKNMITRADKSTDVIVGLGTYAKSDADGYVMYSTGTYITGYYHNGRFYDSFIIETAYADLRSAEMDIARIRKITDIYYYNGGRK